MKHSGSWGALALLGLLAALLIGAAAGYEYVQVGRIYPGVHAGGVDVGGLPRAEAAQTLRSTLEAVGSRQLRVQSGLPGDSRAWTTTFADLGLHYDINATVAAAYAVGRQAGPVARLWMQFVAPLGTSTVPAVYTLDDAKLQAFVATLGTSIDQPVIDAGIRLTGIQLGVTAAQEGRKLDRADAATQLRARVGRLSTAPVALKVAVSLPVTGNGDIGDAVAQARRWVSTDLTLETPVGSSKLSRDQIAALIHLSQPGGKGPVTATLDTVALRGLLAPLADQVRQPGQSAAFAIQDGALVVVKPGQDGRSLDLNTAVQVVSDAVKSGQGVLRLPVPVVQPDLYSLEDAADIQAQVARLAGKPVTLQAGAKSWTLAPKDLSALLSLGTVQRDGHQQLSLTVQADGAAAVVQNVAQEIDQTAQSARFTWDNGALKVTAPSQPGRELDQVAATKALLDAMQGTQRSVALPVTVLKPAATGDHPEAMGIKELVAQGTSNFDGSPPERITNIKRGAELINGAVIAPGEVFSFDDTVGDISTANGFVTGLVILDHETKDGVGGGICQVSTTAFRAAFWAGLPILERHDHAYAVPYYTQGGYPDGFDATIYSPQLDLKFKNDGSSFLLLQTSMDLPTNTLTVSLYGTKSGRTVKLTPGPISNRIPHPPDLRKTDATLPSGVVKQVDWAHDGFDTWIERTITTGATTTTDDFKSHLQPWQAIYVVGTGPASAKRG